MSLQSTRAFVLSYIPYKDHSRLLRCYTETFGFTTFLVSGVGKPKSIMKPAYLYPLTLLEIAFHHTQNKDIFRPKEVLLLESNHDVQTHVVKSAIAQFMAELTQKLLQQSHQKDEQIFDLILYYTQLLNKLQLSHCINIPCHFIAKFTQVMGFSPDETALINFSYHHQHNIHSKQFSLAQFLLTNEYETVATLPLNSADRSWVIQRLLAHLSQQLQLTLQLNSIDVLKSIF